MDDGVEGRDRAGSGVALGGFDRRRFLGVAAAGAFSLAACGMTGCDSTADVSPGAGHGRTESERSAAGERRRSGSPDWRIRSLGPPDAIEGYADKVSVLPGEAFGLHVSTTAPGFRVSAYRIGWYGGAQAPAPSGDPARWRADTGTRPRLRKRHPDRTGRLGAYNGGAH